MPDPLVSKVLAGVTATGAPAATAQIRGYLVDWIVKREDGQSIWEMAVMKDGSVFRVSAMRPAGAFGRVPLARLQPEPVAEANARKAAVAAADAWVDEHRSDFATVTPDVYNYLVRITRSDESTIDVWVDPDVGRGRFFYDVRLKPLTD